MQSPEQITSATAKYELIEAMSFSRGTRFLNENPDAIAAMTDQDVAECMFTAATLGYLLVMDALWASRGPFAVVYENEEGGDVGRLNGVAFTPIRNKLLPFAPKAGRLRKIFDSIRQYGIKGLIEPGHTYPFLFKEINLKTLVGLQASRRFEGELPFIDDNTLHHPELALAMEAEGQRTGMNEAYQPMLCWATEDMIVQHGAQLAPLRTMQNVEFFVPKEAPEQGLSFVTKTVAQFKADPEMGDPVIIHNIALGIEPDDRHSSAASLLLGSMGSEDIQNGFADPQGRVLCETRADFLLGFSLAQGSVENEAHAHQFITDGFPLGILANHTAKVCREEFAHDLTEFKHPTFFSRPLSKNYDPDSDTFYLMNIYTGEASKKLVGMLRPDQWRSLFKYSNTKNIRLRGLVTFRDVLQMDNLGMKISIESDDIDELDGFEYRFREGTVVVNTTEEYDAFVKRHPDGTCVLLRMDTHHVIWNSCISGEQEIFDEVLRLHTQLQKMNIWTGDGASAPGAKESLDCLVRLGGVDVNSVRVMGTIAHLIDLGVDASAQAASSAEHWSLIAKVFSAEQLQPYLLTMPREIRGMVLEGAMGL
jgi:hypothetical protein